MKSASEEIMTTHSFRVTIPSWPTPVHIWPVGDMHKHAPGHDRDRWLEWLRSAREQLRKHPHTYFLLMGDEDELNSASERRGLRSIDLHGSTRVEADENAYNRCEELARELSFAEGHIIGAIQGNHHWVFATTDNAAEGELPRYVAGQTTTQLLCQKLSCAWLGYLSYIRLTLQHESVLRSKAGGKSYGVDIVACHGKAGGKLLGTSVNQIDDLRNIFPVADIYLMGHNHMRSGTPDSRLVVPKSARQEKPVIKHIRQWLVRTGSFLKAYTPGVPEYSVSRLLRPADLGTVRLTIEMRRFKPKNTGDHLIPDIHCWA